MKSPEYIAGIIDGEGSLMLQLSEKQHKDGTVGLHFNPRVSICFKHKEREEKLLYDIQKTINGGRIYISNIGTDKAIVSFYTTRIFDTLKLCELVKPYLCLKEKQADMLIEACKLIQERHRGYGMTSGVKGIRTFSKEDYQKLVTIATTMNAGLQSTRWRETKGRNTEYYLKLVDKMYGG